MTPNLDRRQEEEEVTYVNIDRLRRLLGYPTDLPNLTTLQPPSNTRPEGIAESHFARRERGELPTEGSC